MVLSAEFENYIFHPPKWKMAIVSFIAAYSISLVAHSILSIYLGQRPLLTEILSVIAEMP
ncbi:MAG: hypothetical protein WAZ77_18010 [Candidatus Nitrosopolaris sp.]